MANNQQSSSPTYVLKVNLHCCNACPNNIRRKLSKIPGVVSVDMDIAAGLVKVTGVSNLDPSILVKTIVKTGKKAQFPAKANTAPVAKKPPYPAMENTTPVPASTPIGNKAQCPTMENMTPAPICQKAQCPTMENMTPTPAPVSMPTRAATADIVSNHHNNPSIHSNNHSYKFDQTQYGNSDHHGWSDKVHMNEPAVVNPLGALPLRNQQFMHPPLQYGGAGFRGSHGFWPRMSEPLLPPSPMPPMPLAHGYYRWSKPLPYYMQVQPPPMGNAPGHYLFNDENTEGCMIV